LFAYPALYGVYAVVALNIGLYYSCIMDLRCWLILSWNIRGMNFEDKCLALKNKVDESGCSIICLQETKKSHFDNSSITKFCHRCFDKFEFIPSIGTLGGLIII
jgi:hypothetical protein